MRTTRLRAARKVNTELIALYWRVGRLVLDRQNQQGLGGLPRSSSDSRRIFGWSFPRCAVSPPEAWRTCGRWQRRGRRNQLCGRLPHNCPGSPPGSSWTACTLKPTGTGTRPAPQIAIGAGKSSNTTSPPTCDPGQGPPRATSTRPLNPRFRPGPDDRQRPVRVRFSDPDRPAGRA